MTSLDEGDQAANLLSQILNTMGMGMGMGISDDLMPRELDDERHGPRLNPVVWD